MPMFSEYGAMPTKTDPHLHSNGSQFMCWAPGVASFLADEGMPNLREPKFELSALMHPHTSRLNNGRVLNSNPMQEKPLQLSEVVAGKPIRKKKEKKVSAKKIKQHEARMSRAAPTVRDFFEFMVRREECRVKKAQGLPREEWTSDVILKEYKFTNVKRIHDHTTAVLHRILDRQRPLWLAAAEKKSARPNKAEEGEPATWTAGQDRLAELILINTALWRMFGTVEFAVRLGWLSEWDEESHKKVLDTAMEMFSEGVHVFTDAYQPQSVMYNAEIKARRELDACKSSPEDAMSSRFFTEGKKGEAKKKARAAENKKATNGDKSASPVPGAGAQKAYLQAITRVDGVWEARKELLAAVQTRSWKETCGALSGVKWFGGSGFHAKELVQDLLKTVLFERFNPETQAWSSVCIDDATWSPLGPGARRGMNRMKQRNVQAGVTDKTVPESTFLDEMKEIFAVRNKHWPETIGGQPAVSIDELHDIQFQLCEFDKYQRVMHSEGKSRRYKPRNETEPDSTPTVAVGD